MLCFVPFKMLSLTKCLTGALLQTPPWCSKSPHKRHFSWVCSVKYLGKGFQPYCITGFKLYERRLYVEKCRTTCRETGGYTIVWLPAFPPCKTRARNCSDAVADAASIILVQPQRVNRADPCFRGKLNWKSAQPCSRFHWNQERCSTEQECTLLISCWQKALQLNWREAKQGGGEGRGYRVQLCTII